MTKLTSSHTVLFRCGALAVLVCASYWSVRVSMADYLSRRSDLYARELAVRLAPSSATYYERLADKHEELGVNPLPPLWRAASLEPGNASRWLRLGLAAELAGDLPEAEKSLLRSAQLSRLYQPRYLLAQYYFRRGNAGAFRHWSHEALQTAFGDVSPLLDLGWRICPEPNAHVREALSLQPHAAREYLAYLMRHAPAAALTPLARGIAERASAGDLPMLLAWCDRALESGETEGVLDVWNALCRTRHLPYQPLHTGELTNAAFDRTPAGHGFDWHIEVAAGIAVSFAREMRINFSGKQPESCVIAWQYVPVAAGARYRLEWEASAVDADSVDGIAFTPAPAFTATAGLVRVALVYRRPAGSTRLAGTVAIRGVHLRSAS